MTAAICFLAQFGPLVTPKFLPALIFTMPVSVLVLLGMLIDAFVIGRRAPRLRPDRLWLRYGAGIAAFAVAGYVNPSMIAAYAVREWWAEAFVIRGRSMAPTLEPGDRVILHKHWQPHRWSLVIIEHPAYHGASVISRVVGMPGEAVEVRAGQPYIDGELRRPPDGIGPYDYVLYTGLTNPELRGRPDAGCEGNPIRLGENEYYVLGDNSIRAFDARLWEVPVPGRSLGALPVSNIKGCVTAIYWPPNKWKSFD